VDREVAPPKGGLLAMDKPMTLPSYEYCDKFCVWFARWWVLRWHSGATQNIVIRHCDKIGGATVPVNVENRIIVRFEH
jgi:hypothetical protein